MIGAVTDAAAAAPDRRPEPSRDRRLTAVRIRPRAALAIALATVAGVAMFAWPLLTDPGPGAAHGTDAPFVFIAILPVLVLVVAAELVEGGVDAKALAMLGVLSAINAVLRPLGAGTAGIETIFFLLILGGRIHGPGFGFLLGSTSLFTSALLTGGVGPWLPFQMMAASWVGLGAGLLPRARGRVEIVLLAGYGALAAYAYGFAMNLWFWPFALGTGTDLSYVAGAPLLDNLHRFVLFTLATSTWGWDTGRAVTNVVAISVVGPPVLTALRRAARKASFGAVPGFSPPPGRPVSDPD